MTRVEAAVLELVAAVREEIAAAAASGSGAPDRLLSIDQAADAMGCGRTALYAELQAGRLRSVRIGRRRLVPASAIVERINGRAS